jgi:hypothetical protein
MSDKTRADLLGAVEAHSLDRQSAALSGQHPATVDDSAARAAARAHLDDVDPGYAEREAGKAPHDRQVAPDLKAAYDQAQIDWQDDPTPEHADAMREAGEHLAAARTAQRVAEGRWETAAVTVNEGDTDGVE